MKKLKYNVTAGEHMPSINKVFIMGHLGKNPEMTQLQTGNIKASFSVATSEYMGKDIPKRTEWHNIEVWGKLAENCQKYIQKGSLVHVEGRLQTQSWEKEGQKHYKTIVNATDIKFLNKENIPF